MPPANPENEDAAQETQRKKTPRRSLRSLPRAGKAPPETPAAA